MIHDQLQSVKRPKKYFREIGIRIVIMFKCSNIHISEIKKVLNGVNIN